MSCKVLVDGYIGSSTGVSQVEEIAKVGNTLTVSGILYMNPDGTCIRVRDRAEIIKVAESEAPTPDETPDPIPVKHGITYQLNGGVNAKENPTTFVEGEAVTLAHPVKRGYTFAGWYTDASLKTALKDNTISAITNTEVTVYAKWKAITYKIQFNKNSVHATGTMKSISATYGTNVKLTKNTLKRTGYTFYGWATSPNGKIVYKNASSIKGLTTVNGKTVTLYAKGKKVSVSQTKSLSLKGISSKN